MKRRWIKSRSTGTTLTEKVLDAAGIPEGDREMFIKGTIADLRSAKEMKDGEKAGVIVEKFIRTKEKIIVYTDYDSDGAAGGAVAVMMLRELGAEVDYYTNNRFTQGYGMCPSGVDEILKNHPDTKLIFTVDNGISAYDGIGYAKERGLAVVVTDHHEPGEFLPEADAVVDPKRKDCGYPFKGICGATVAWKVLRELYKYQSDADKYLDILAIATVGDVVPLIDENRIIVREGIKMLDKETRYSLKLLKGMTGVTKVNAMNTLGFLYVPIINAVGRLDGNINPVIEMYMSEAESFLRPVIEEFVELNRKRKVMTEEQTGIAEEMIEVEKLPEVIVVYNPTFHEGIVGLIAGRLKEKYNRPTIVLTQSENGGLKGSARSIEGFDIKASLDACRDLLGGYGGHPMAAGLSLSEDHLEAFEDRLIELARKHLTEENFIRKFHYIDSYPEKDITQCLVEEFSELEPFGAGFPKPLIRLDRFKVQRVFCMGSEKNHLKLIGGHISAIGWRQAETYEKRGNPLMVSALGCPEINIFRNTVNVQFMIDNDNFL